ncbi:MAG: GNAT family N-acetyltransferase, partial [Ruminiclostridium sp.]|nr:GNAT family N-acetyltransferase [Ruminiclostridium sp.]
MRFAPIETERLILRPLEIADTEHIFSTWTSDPRVTRFMIYATHKNAEETRQWLESVTD